MSQATGARLLGSIHGTTDLAEFASCDLVIEAVTEILDLKKRVFAELETVVSPTAILATNTSALSVSAMAADLQHPERVVGLHFFNPVAAMPLVEVVQAEHTSLEALATGFAVAAKLRKTAVLVADRPGFVVNRLLVLLLGVIVDAVEHGTPVEVADRALRPARAADAAVRAVRPRRTGRRAARARRRCARTWATASRAPPASRSSSPTARASSCRHRPRGCPSRWTRRSRPRSTRPRRARARRSTRPACSTACSRR